MTNKEHLESISVTVDKLAKSHYKFVATVSAYMNEQNDANSAQDKMNTKIVSYLYNDKDTGKDGAIQMLSKHDKRLDTLETRNKITTGKILTATAILTFVGGIFYKIIDSIDK